MNYVRAGKKPPKNSSSSKAQAILHQNFRKLRMNDGNFSDKHGM
jgi:hypothetical protein